MPGTRASFAPGVTATNAGNGILRSSTSAADACALRAPATGLHPRARGRYRQARRRARARRQHRQQRDAPHLHFHVMDGPSPLASNVPYGIDAFTVSGRHLAERPRRRAEEGRSAGEGRAAAASRQAHRRTAGRSGDRRVSLSSTSHLRRRAAARPSRYCSAWPRSRRRCASSPPRAADAMSLLRQWDPTRPTRPARRRLLPSLAGWSFAIPTTPRRTGNEIGFRGPVVSVPKPPGTYWVVRRRLDQPRLPGERRQDHRRAPAPRCAFPTGTS